MKNNQPLDLAHKALDRVEAISADLKTKLNGDLFQLIARSLKISPFVAGVVNRQCEPTLTQILWHSSHQSSDFSDYLQCQIINDLVNQPAKVNWPGKGNKNNPFSTFSINDFSTHYISETAIMAWLRSVRQQHSAAIAALELNTTINIEESMARMSILADQLIQIAYLWSYATQKAVFGSPTKQPACNPSEPQQNMLILAMGKLGGHELNFSSDIDLIFFYPHPGQTQGGRRKIDNGQFFQKVGVQLIKLLDQVTEDGFVFRVDMRLRPYGDAGNLVTSIEQAEEYYHQQGREWERFAMVRARVITGRRAETELIEKIIRPFAFRRYIDYGVIDSLRQMKQMIQREVRRQGLIGNIKLGTGGIREIEFLAQSLQLIQGGRDKRLQQKSLLKVLPLLTQAKLLPSHISLELDKNYRFLRRLEHCIQELDEKQSQQLPTDSNKQQLIAELMGFSDWKKFKRALDAIQKITNQHFNNLFTEEKTQTAQQDDFYLCLWEGQISNQQIRGKLPNLNEQAVDELIGILTNFNRSNRLKYLSPRGTKRLKKFFPILLATSLNVKNPLQTLKRLIVILRSILKRTAYLDLLSENLPVLQHLVDLASQSDWFVKRLSDHPVLLDELLYPNSLYQPLQSSDLQGELQQSLLRIDEKNEEQMLDAVRHFKQSNELRVAASLLSQQLNIVQVNRYLSQLAEVILQQVLNHCWRKMIEQYGQPQLLHTETAGNNVGESAFSVIAYGKLGSWELAFHSDLDLVFLFNQPLSSHTSGLIDHNKNEIKNKISSSRFYTKLAQKIIYFLVTRTAAGILYPVDMRLRPSGNSGLLVSHIEAFEDYQRNNAWTWEHQALVRARPVAGDLHLNQLFEQIRKNVLSIQGKREKIKNDLLNMRLKMRKELDHSTNEKLDLKQCVGGLVDIEFLSQYLILTGDHVDTDSIPTNTERAIKYALSKQQINKKEANGLIEAYRNYRNCLNQNAIISDQETIHPSRFTVEREEVRKTWEQLFHFTEKS